MLKIKKVLIAILPVFVIAVFWIIGSQIQSSEVQPDSSTTPSDTTPIAYTYKDEPDDGSGNSFGNAIYVTSLFASSVTEDGITDQSDYDTIVTYTEGAIGWADKINASDQIKSELNKALKLSKQNKLSEASEVLFAINQKYNNDKIY